MVDTYSLFVQLSAISKILIVCLLYAVEVHRHSCCELSHDEELAAELWKMSFLLDRQECAIPASSARIKLRHIGGK